MIDKAIGNFRKYVYTSLNASKEFSFTLNSPTSKFSLIFGIFSLNLIKEEELLINNSVEWSKKILKNLNDYYKERKNNNNDLMYDKPYLQLLTFSLSALKILKFENQNLIDNIINNVFPNNLNQLLEKTGALNGNPGSGNFAMFYAIILLSSNSENKEKLILNWADIHYKNMNNNGFWGKHLNHLSFQNGYHQYEIFKYINYKIDSKIKKRAINHIIQCSDSNGHFAPYPGGGACFDYDAVFLLDYLDDKKNNKSIIKVFKKLRKTLLNEQNIDGGFAENKYVRPFAFFDFTKCLMNSKTVSIFIERLKHFVFFIVLFAGLLLQHLCQKHNIIFFNWL